MSAVGSLRPLGPSAVNLKMFDGSGPGFQARPGSKSVMMCDLRRPFAATCLEMSDALRLRLLFGLPSGLSP